MSDDNIHTTLSSPKFGNFDISEYLDIGDIEVTSLCSLVEIFCWRRNYSMNCMCVCMSFMFQERKGHSALTLAAQDGHVDIVELLLNNGMNIDEEGPVGGLLVVGCWSLHVVCVSLGVGPSITPLWSLDCVWVEDKFIHWRREIQSFQHLHHLRQLLVMFFFSVVYSAL